MNTTNPAALVRDLITDADLVLNSRDNAESRVEGHLMNMLRATVRDEDGYARKVELTKRRLRIDVTDADWIPGGSCRVYVLDERQRIDVTVEMKLDARSVEGAPGGRLVVEYDLSVE